MDIDNSSIIEEFNNLTKDDVQFSKNCAKLAHDIQRGQLSIVQLIEQLKTLLVGTSPSSRELGTLILSEVLQSLPVDFLSSTQLNFICTFYSDRLKDHHQVIPSVLSGILSIVNFKNIPDGGITQILSSLFHNVPCQQQQQADRRVIYNILKISLEKKCSELLAMNYDFVYGVISAMDGERDPRNLLYLFEWLPTFLKAVNLGHLTEEMFEVMACYFPVDFKAPSQDPNSIGRDTLASALCPCLCGTDAFAEFCLPLATEKLSSSLNIAKIDSLNLLIEGCKTFSSSSYVQHSTEIWSLIQKEIFSCTDKEYENLCLVTLTTVIKKISLDKDADFKKILSDIVDVLKGNLRPDTKLFEQSWKMLLHVAKACEVSAKFVITEIAPLLTNSYNITTTPSHKISLFNCLITFVKVYIDVHEHKNIDEVNELSLVPNLCIKATLHQEDSVRAAGFEALGLLADSIPSELRNCLYTNLCKLLITPEKEVARNSLLNCFKAFARLYPSEIQNNVLNQLEVPGQLSLRLYLDTLSKIAVQSDFMDTALRTLVNHSVKDLPSAEIAFENIKAVIGSNENNERIHSRLLKQERIIPKTTDWILENLQQFDTQKSFQLFANIRAVFKSLIGFQPSEIQGEIAVPEINKIILVYRNKQNGLLIILLDGLITRLNQDINVQFSITNDLTEFAVACETECFRNVAVQLLANILNKSSEENSIEKYLEAVKNRYVNSLEDGISNKNRYENVISLISWVTKALVMRGHSEADMWLTKMVELLNQHQSVASGFKIIMDDSYESLSSKSFCRKRLLYQQKTFTQVSSMLSRDYADDNTNFLLAVGYLLQNVPKKVLKLEFKKILRLIVLCLEKCTDANVLLAILETLYMLIQSKETVIDDHIQDLLPRFLILAKYKPSMKVRVKALQCLQQCIDNYPIYKLLPHKQDVIYSLAQCLDDPKRLVRKEAVAARSRWFLLDAPT